MRSTRPTALLRWCWDRVRPDQQTIHDEIKSGTIDRSSIPTVDEIGSEYWDYESAESTRLYEIGTGMILGSWDFRIADILDSYCGTNHTPTVNEIKQLDQLQVDIEPIRKTNEFVTEFYSRCDRNAVADCIQQLYVEQLEQEPVTSCFQTVEMDAFTRTVEIADYDTVPTESVGDIPVSMSRDERKIDWQQERNAVSVANAPVQDEIKPFVAARASDALHTIIDSCDSEQADDAIVDTVLDAIETIDESGGIPDCIATDESIYQDTDSMPVDEDAQYIYNCDVGIDTHDLVGANSGVSAIVADRKRFGLEVVQNSDPSVAPDHIASHSYTINNYYSYVTKEAPMCRFITMSGSDIASS